MADVFESLRAGLAHHQAGRLAEAEALYRAVLASEPDQPQALNLLGVLCAATGRIDEALKLLSRAAELEPDNTDIVFNLGNALYRKGDAAAALAHYRDVAARRPGYAEVFANMGPAYQDTGRLDDAIAACRNAIKLKPALAAGHMNLGRALLDAGRYQEAIAAFKEALARRPNSAEAQVNLANGLYRAGQVREAAAAARAAVALDAKLGDAHSMLGTVLRELGDTENAVAALRRAIALQPKNAHAHANLGNALVELDLLPEAEAEFRAAIALDPDLAEAHSGLGFLFTSLRRLPEAIAACDQAIRLKPDFAEAHWNQGFAYLLAGDFAHGWEKYEWRKRHPRFAAAYTSFPQPSWEGEALGGKTLLIHAEQGLGDSIQFIRYAAPIAASGGRIVVACDRALIPLFKRAPGIAAAVDKSGPLPDFDLWIDQMSLPRVMRTRADAIPEAGGYLTADPARAADWRRSLPEGLKVGIVWAGNPGHSNDRRRSMPVEHVRPLLGVPGISVFSLQVGARSRELATLAPAPIADLAPRLTDFMETAAAVATLDLTIAVDTAVAHLAGALGRPVWVLLPYDPDWRWLLSHDRDSPWYASMRLFRQPSPRDWAAVAEAVAADLKKLASGDRQVLRP